MLNVEIVPSLAISSVLFAILLVAIVQPHTAALLSIYGDIWSTAQKLLKKTVYFQCLHTKHNFCEILFHSKSYVVIFGSYKREKKQQKKLANLTNSRLSWTFWHFTFIVCIWTEWIEWMVFHWHLCLSCWFVCVRICVCVW